MNRREYELKQANCGGWVARIGAGIMFGALVGGYGILGEGMA
mgnify:CR=1 FL=1